MSAEELSLPGDAIQHPEAPRVAGYCLATRLGRGAYGEVWRAWQTRTRRWVAWLRGDLPPQEILRRARVATVKLINEDGDVQIFDLQEWRRLQAGGMPR